MNTEKPIIYFDMDDVGNELCKFLMDRYNKDYNDDMNWLENEHAMIWDNERFRADKEYIFKIMYEKGAFLNHEPMPGFVECVKKLIDEGYKVRFLTFPQWESPYCVSEKVEWVKKYLPFFDLNHLIMTKLKGEIAGENKILLDDSPSNLSAWEENGGVGVSFAKIKYSQSWKGHKVFNFKEFYNLIKEIEKLG